MKILESIKHPHLLALFILTTAVFYAAYSLTVTNFPSIDFTPVQNIYFGWAFVLLDVIFLVKGFIEYQKSKDRRIAILACCFFMGGLFEIPHILASYEGHLQMAYSSLVNISYAIPGLATLFFMSNPTEENDKHFFFKILAACIITFGVVYYAFSSMITPEMARHFYSLSGTEMIYAASYFVTAIIYANARKSLGKDTLSLFSLGYFLLFLNELSIPTHTYLSSIYRLFVHIEMGLGILLIMLGTKNLPVTDEDFNSKLKSYLLPFGYLILIYILILLLSSDTFNILIPRYLQFYFLVFFITLMFTE